MKGGNNMCAEELVIIFKQRAVKNEHVLIPIDCVLGIFDDNYNAFIDEDEYVYDHFSNFFPGRCFGLRHSLENIYKLYPDTDLDTIKEKFLTYFKNGKFTLTEEEHRISLIFSPNGKDISYVVESVDIDDYGNAVDLHCDYGMYDEEPVDEISEIDDLCKSDDTSSLEQVPLSFRAKMVRNKIKETVIGQDKSVDKIVTTIWRNLRQKEGTPVKNILVSGPTGSGKTEIFRTLSKIVDIPIIEVDANPYTAAGYVGSDIEDMLIKLLVAANGDVNKANRGIIIIDEFDKLAGTGKNDEVSTTKVQDALLKMVEGYKYRLSDGKGIYHVDTTGITFVGAGSFARVSKNKSRPMGFNNDIDQNQKKLVDEDVIDFGFEPEILGRFPVRVTLHKLEIEDLVKIILESNKSAFKDEIKFLEENGIETIIEDQVIEQIARKAYETGNGARGISRIITDVFEEILRELSDEDEVYKSLELKNGITEDNKRYVLKK